MSGAAKGCFLALLVALGSCGGYAGFQWYQGHIPATVVSATDGASHIKIPHRWTKLDHLNARALIQAGDAQDDDYVIVLTEAKSDVPSATNLEAYAALALATDRSAFPTEMQVSAPTRIDVGGSPAIQYELESAGVPRSDGYLVTFLEGKTDFHQVVAWTGASSFDDHRALLARVTNSFGED